MKPDNPGINHNNNTALQSLSALSQNLGQTDRSMCVAKIIFVLFLPTLLCIHDNNNNSLFIVDRRKPGPKPRRIPPFTQSESSHLSSGSEENDSSTSVHKVINKNLIRYYSVRDNNLFLYVVASMLIVLNFHPL